MFWNRSKSHQKDINSEEYEKLSKRLIEFDARILNLETSEKIFRDKVLRKIQTKLPEQEEDAQNIGIKMFGGRH